MTITPKETAEFLRSRDRYLILTHIRPDGDTIGCAAALCRCLRALGKTAHILSNPGATATYSCYLDGLCAPADYVPDTVVAVDVAATGLFFPEEECWAEKTDLCIDHHPSNTFYARATCVDPSLAACGELIYEICMTLGVMDAAMAEALYVAISTDTGCFVYSNTSPRTHRTAAALMEYGDFAPAVNKRCFRTRSAVRLRIESRLMSEARFYQDGRIAIGAVTRAMMEETGAGEQDVEEISSFLGQIEGVSVAVTMREQADDRVKISVRTDSTLNAGSVCAVFGGGGHAAAAGGMINLPLDRAREAVYQAICRVQAGEC